MKVVVLGSIAIDHICFSNENFPPLMGGSACYASFCASFFNSVGIVGAVGSDYPKKYFELLKGKNRDLSGITHKEGRTFFWKGLYSSNFDSVETLEVSAGVYEDFSPLLPQNYRKAKCLFLANIDPDLQKSVLDQMTDRPIVVLNTILHWIETKRKSLLELFKRVDVLIVNESESFELTGQNRLVPALKTLINMGLSAVVITCGENGSLALDKKGAFFSVPAYPLESIKDTTGAGDSFCGGFVGHLSQKKDLCSDEILTPSSLAYGTVMSSFTVEDLSLKSLTKITQVDIEKRYGKIREMTQLG